MKKRIDNISARKQVYVCHDCNFEFISLWYRKGCPKCKSRDIYAGSLSKQHVTIPEEYYNTIREFINRGAIKSSFNDFCREAINDKIKRIKLVLKRNEEIKEELTEINEKT